MGGTRGRDLGLKAPGEGGAGLCLGVGKDFLEEEGHFRWGFEG